MRTIVFCLTIISLELSSSFPFPDTLPRYYGSYEPVGVPEQRGIPQQLQSNIAHSQNSYAPTVSYQPQLDYIQQENIRRQNYENLWRIQQNEQQAARNQRLVDQSQARPMEQNYNSQPVINTGQEPYNSIPLQQPTQQNYQPPITQQYYPAQQNQQYVDPYLREAPQQYQVPNKPQPVAQSGPVQENNPYQQYQPQPQYNAQYQAYQPRVQQALASSPHKKRYLVLHPNGTVEHIDKIESFVQKHPNYVLMNAGDYQRNYVANAKVQGPTPPNARNTVNYPQQPVIPAAPVAPKPPVAPTPPVASAAPVAPAAASAPVTPVAPETPVAQATAGPVATVASSVPVSPVGPAKPVAPVAPATPSAETAQTSAGRVTPTAPEPPVASEAKATNDPVAPASPVVTPAPVAQIPAPYPVKLPTPVPSPSETPLPPVASEDIPSPVIQNGTVPTGPKPTVEPPSGPTTTRKPVKAPTAQSARVVTATDSAESEDASAESEDATAVTSAETKPDEPSEASADVKPTPKDNSSTVAPRKPDAVANATVVKTGPKHDFDLLQVNSKTEPVVWFRTKDLDFWDKLTSGDETFDVLYFFNIPREPRVERDTKTTIHPNGTVVEEITQTIYDDEDSPPRIVKTTTVTLPENDEPET